MLWSTQHERAGLRIMITDKEGNRSEASFIDPVVKEINNHVLQITCKDEKENLFSIVFYEDCFEIACKPKKKGMDWMLELKTAPEAKLPFLSFEEKSIKASFRNFNYMVNCKEGTIKQGDPSDNVVFRLIPSNNKVVIDCTND
jgi:hypothetical protein